MISSVLVLYETDASVIDGEIPSCIELSRSNILIGRGSPLKPVDVVLSAKKESKEIISRQHAEIFRNRNGDFEIKDLNALNGLFVNGVRVACHALRNNDIIQFGGLCDVPIGKTLEASDLCVKYKFLLNHILSSSGKKRSNEDAPTSPVKITRVDVGVRSHSPLNGRVQSAYPKLELNTKSPTSSPEKKPQQCKSGDSLSSSGSVKHQVSTDSTASLIASNKEHESGNAQSEAKVSLKVLMEHLNCTLCNNVLLDAVVLQCSHGYCRCCIEKHVRKMKSTCPVCNNAAANPLSSTQRSTGYLNIVYNRSAHLDLLVNHLFEASSVETNELFTGRETTDRQTLIRLGINPDINRASSTIDSQKSGSDVNSRRKGRSSTASSDSEDKGSDNEGSSSDSEDEE